MSTVIVVGFFVIELALLTGLVWCWYSMRLLDVEFGYFARLWSMRVLNDYYTYIEEGFIPVEDIDALCEHNVNKAVTYLKKYGVPDRYGAVEYRVDKDL